ncbi:MAG: undecaprenyl-phosphate glucose phosphotransferase [Pseudoflavonifractor sp.]|nr:undecaprenyl-phosphate glucose phosphotransferase [Alloprevotella sp.]MCM1117687.1 undecaprenyl-phosphate glucose phosphotransferase [Pseudoflavonifractor sp.]
MAAILQKGRYGRYIHYILTALDFIVINIAFLVTAWLEPTLVEERSRTVWLLANLTYIPVAYWLRNTHKSRTIQMDHVVANALRGVGAHALFFISALYFVGIEHVDWQAFAIFYGFCGVAFPLWWSLSRMALKRYRRRGGNFSGVAIIGTDATARRILEEINSDYGFGYKVLGMFDDNPSPGLPDDIFTGTIDDLKTFMAETRVNEIFYALSGDDEKTMKRVIDIADDAMVHFYYVPRLNAYVNRGCELTALGSMPIISFLRNPLRSFTNRAIKRAFDLFFSGACLILSPIVLIPVAIAIKVSSPGPIFFRQKRTGYRGREFECLKFRTMCVNDQADALQASKDDPRKTRVGNFLRHTSIDELPQMWNVFMGHMSLVGPRPHMLSHTEEYSRLIDKYMVRHMVKPGITGWAQVNGYRGATRELWQMEKRVKYDVWYIEHWSALLDLKIVVRTVINAIRGEQNAF